MSCNSASLATRISVSPRRTLEDASCTNAQWTRTAYVPSSTTTSFPNGTIAPILSEDGDIPFGCKNDTAITPANAKDQVLFLKRGKCTFSEKLENAKQVGAIAILFYDPDVSSKTVVVAKTEEGNLPCAGIELKVATRLIQSMQESNTSNSIRIGFPDEQKIIFPETAGRISEFSSTGPNYELDLKPSVTGIGGDVYSTLPQHVTGGWGVRSGTSMASPHVAGAAALLVNYYAEQKRDATPAYIMEQLQNHGRLILSDNGRIENPVVQGAGLIQRTYIHCRVIFRVACLTPYLLHVSLRLHHEQTAYFSCPDQLQRHRIHHSLQDAHADDYQCARCPHHCGTEQHTVAVHPVVRQHIQLCPNRASD